MAKEPRLVLTTVNTGAESSPWLDDHRKRFAAAAKRAKEEMRDSPLRGANRVIAFNNRIREILRGGDV